MKDTQDKIRLAIGAMITTVILLGVLALYYSVKESEETRTMPSWEEKADSDTEQWGDTPCSIILSPSVAEAHIGACFKDYWKRYSECSLGGSFFGSGCIILEGDVGFPWCYPENCQ